MWDIFYKVLATLLTLFIAWLIKKAPGWYRHYKNGRDARWIGLMEVQKMQAEKLDAIIKQLSPNSGQSVFDKVEQVLDNQSIIKETSDSLLYMDETPIVKSSMLGRCTFVNLAYLRMSGFETIEEAMGSGAIRSVHPEDRERVTKEYTEAFKYGSQLVTTYRKINLRTNEVFLVQATIRVIRNSKGEPVETIGVLHRLK